MEKVDLSKAVDTKVEAKVEAKKPTEIDGVTKVVLPPAEPVEPKKSVEPVVKTPVEPKTGDSIEPKKTAEPKKATLKEIKVEKKDETDVDVKPPVTAKKVDEVKPLTKVEPKVEESPGITKLKSFLKDNPGATIQDFARLDFDYSTVDDMTKLREFYKRTKKGLTNSDIEDLIEDNFSYEDDVDDEKFIRKQQRNKKEEIAKATDYLIGMKDKYYEEIKSKTSLSEEQAKAVAFYDKYNQGQDITQKQSSKFKEVTDEVFNDKFEGFDFNVGEKTYRYSVEDKDKVKSYQSDISNFVGEFLDEDGMMKDAAGYHRSLFAAKHADAIAKHFYQQGAADALSKSMEESKNIDMSGRTTHGPVIEAGGIKVRTISGEDSGEFKIKLGQKFKMK